MIVVGYYILFITMFRVWEIVITLREIMSKFQFNLLCLFDYFLFFFSKEKYPGTLLPVEDGEGYSGDQQTYHDRI